MASRDCVLRDRHKIPDHFLHILLSMVPALVEKGLSVCWLNRCSFSIVSSREFEFHSRLNSERCATLSFLRDLPLINHDCVWL